MATRSKTAIWLFGQPLHILDELRPLSLSSTTLRRIFFEMKTMHSTLPAAGSTVADEVLSFWARANIPTTEKPHVVRNLRIYISSTVNIGFNDIGFNDKSLITTYFSCPEVRSSILHTLCFGYNDMLYNDTSNLSTYFYARCLEIPSDITTLECRNVALQKCVW